MVNNSLAAPAVTNAADAEFKGACKGLLVACERWSLLSECSHVLQLLSKAGIQISSVFHGRLIDAGADARRERANRGGARADTDPKPCTPNLSAPFYPPPGTHQILKRESVAQRLGSFDQAPPTLQGNSHNASTVNPAGAEDACWSNAGGKISVTECSEREAVEGEALKGEVHQAVLDHAVRAVNARSQNEGVASSHARAGPSAPGLPPLFLSSSLPSSPASCPPPLLPFPLPHSFSPTLSPSSYEFNIRSRMHPPTRLPSSPERKLCTRNLTPSTLRPPP